MKDLSNLVNEIEKFNNSNYNNWSYHIRFYLLGQDLQDIVGSKDTTVLMDVEESREWKIKVCKAQYVLAIIVEDEWLQHIKSAKTPKEAQDMLAAIFTRTNDAKLQCLDNELLSISQQDMTVSKYFSRIKSLCDEIYKLDPQNVITKTRNRRIIIHRLRP